MPTLISQNTTWTSGQIVDLTDDVQIAPGVTLTIEEGVVVNGNDHAIVVDGTLIADANDVANAVTFNDTLVRFGSASGSLRRIEFDAVDMNGGSFLPPVGAYGSFSVRNSNFVDVDGFSISFPEPASEFVGNTFTNSQGISIGTQGTTVLIQNNAFYGSTAARGGDSTIVVWLSYGDSDLVSVIENTFYDSPGVSTYLELSGQNGNAALFAEGNYFEASDGTDAEDFVLDWEDDISRGSGIDTSTQAAAPNPATPTINRPATGAVTLSGAAAQNQTLTADASGLDDPDGLGPLSYQWFRGDVAVDGATAATYGLTQADVGSLVHVQVSYTDLAGNAETVTSAATTAVANVNDAPVGNVVLSGSAIEDQILSVDTSALTDADGLGTLQLQWLRDGVVITGATGNSYQLGDDDPETSIQVRVSYTDAHGTAESVLSNTLGPVENLNDNPVGIPVILGDLVQGNTLTVDISGISDADGIDHVSQYIWMVDGVHIHGNEFGSLELTQDFVGARITVQFEYTDNYDQTENPQSAQTAPIANVNDLPRFSGIFPDELPQEDATFTADLGGIMDADGIDATSYGFQWVRDGVAIAGASSSDYTFTQADVGATVAIRISYDDLWGTAETITQTAGRVQNVNDAPSGTPLITGLAVQGSTLGADLSAVTDEDGFDPASAQFQWLRDGVAIAGAAGRTGTYQLVQADVGAALSVRVSYEDDFGQQEQLTSAVTALVQNVNDAPVGLPVIDGATTEGQTLIANVAGVSDPDGYTFLAGDGATFQWLRNGIEVAGATEADFHLTQADVGAEISVRFSYTDDLGATETVTSTATPAIANVDDPATGAPAIVGTAEPGQTLTVDLTGIVDPDGLQGVGYAYVWLRDGQAIPGATSASYQLGYADLHSAIGVRVEFTDALGGQETLSSLTVTPTTTIAGINLIATDTTTDETGDTASVQIRLDTQPTDDVTLTFAVSDDSEAMLPTTQITFTASTWDQVQTVQIVGLDDYLNDGTIPYELSITITTDDPDYGAVTSPAVVALQNLDDGLEIPLEVYGTNAAETLIGNNGADRLYGAGSGDVLIGGIGADRLYGEQGDDLLQGQQGEDQLYGGYDDDTLEGGDGADDLYGEAGADTLVGGAGNDRLDGGTGADWMSGGAGDDTYLVDDAGDVIDDQGSAQDTDTVILLNTITYALGASVENASLDETSGASGLVGNEATNQLDGNSSDNMLSGAGGADTLYSADGNDTVDGGAGDDLIIGGDGRGNDLYLGGSGSDTVKYTSATDGITVDLVSGTAFSTAGGDAARIGTDTLFGIENIIAGAFDDILQGNEDANELQGGAGDDMLNGAGGDDTLLGGAGNDTLSGGAGTDRAIFDYASTDVRVVSGADLFAIRSGSELDHLAYDFEAFEFSDGTLLTLDQVLALTGISVLTAGNDAVETSYIGERIDAGAGDDSITGLQGADSLIGGTGFDTLNGGDGVDTLIGGEGDDVLVGGTSVDDLRDVVYGGLGNDSIDGGYGNDELRGDAGNDTILGGFGADTVIGGDGDDNLTSQAYGDEIFGGAGADFINGGFGHDRVNGGADADRFFHLGVADHGSDWIQDYTVADGDVLQFGQAGDISQFQVNFTETASAGATGVEEAFVIYRPTGQILWALVDGQAQSEINLLMGGVTYDLLA